ADRAGCSAEDSDIAFTQRREGEGRRSRGEAAPQFGGLVRAASRLRAASPQPQPLRAFAPLRERNGGLPAGPARFAGCFPRPVRLTAPLPTATASGTRAGGEPRARRRD